ncbi:MAG: hypothetical protein K0B10_15520 [Vicingaceae bacterium]|nr:hypothetical protein [Vicingaceae bacterium]
MKNITLITAILLNFFSYSQTVSLKIDTINNSKNKEYISYIMSFMNDSIVDNPIFWHPKYNTITHKNFNYNIDWLWRTLPPKDIKTKFYTQIMELQHINDSLSYFKILISDNDSTLMSIYNIYKFYIIKKDEKKYIENCLPIEKNDLFNKIETKNITFYVSRFYNQIKEDEFKKASLYIDSLKQFFRINKPFIKFDYYMCNNEEEMNKLSNIVVWDGGVGGYTNFEQNFIVALTSTPIYAHEFIHILLGKGGSCFFLGEGVASLYGGLSFNTSFDEGKKILKECYINNICNYEDLCKRKSYNNYNNTETYTFAAIICSYIIDSYGIDFFLNLYYDSKINTNNFFNELSIKTGQTPQYIKSQIEQIIKQ